MAKHKKQHAEYRERCAKQLWLHTGKTPLQEYFALGIEAQGIVNKLGDMASFGLPVKTARFHAEKLRNHLLELQQELN